MELSIVLIIIGLIVGGVLGGQSLIKSAELQRMATEITKYRTAVNAFRLEFSALPGDMDNAQDYWPTCTDDNKNLCNGDGNGFVDIPSNLKADVGGAPKEYLRAWQHLSLAGIVPGNYVGDAVAEGGVTTLQPGVSVPALPIDGNIIYLHADNDHKCDRFMQNCDIHTFQIGKADPDEECCMDAYLTPREVKQIDTKIDDGLPAIGRLHAFDGNPKPAIANAECINASDAGSAIDWSGTPGTANAFPAKVCYRLSNKENVCRIFMGAGL